MQWSSRRKVHRLRGYDYSMPGDYFVTVCTAQRACTLGDISSECMVPSECGEIVCSVWEQLAATWAHVAFSAFAIMPNHVHGLITIGCEDPSGPLHMVSDAPDQEAYGSVSLGVVVRRFKALVSYRVGRSGVKGFGWQANYWDHIVRDQDALARIADYIVKNPRNWPVDLDNQQRESVKEADRFAARNGLMLADLPLVGISPDLTSLV